MHPAGFFRRDGLKRHARAAESPAQRAATQWRTPSGVGSASTCGRLKHHRGRKKFSTECFILFDRRSRTDRGTVAAAVLCGSEGCAQVAEELADLPRRVGGEVQHGDAVDGRDVQGEA